MQNTQESCEEPSASRDSMKLSYRGLSASNQFATSMAVSTEWPNTKAWGIPLVPSWARAPEN